MVERRRGWYATLRRVRRILSLAVVGALTFSGCGSSGTPGAGGEEATLVLDAPPNATHVGIYTALAREFDDAEGVKLSVRRSGDGDFAILDVDDLARARERGEDVVAVMAILQRPLLVLAAERTTLRDDRDVVDATTAALRRGYEEALRDPELAAETVARMNRGVDRAAVLRDLRDLGASFTTGVDRFGELDRERLEAALRRRASR
jgi:ABC-type nitrate/sulfonate/bicarbonate transport system substrate-binding protein